MDPFEHHATGIQAIQNVLAGKCPIFTWHAADWNALPGGAHRAKPNSEGGFGDDSDLSITCLVGQFGKTAQAQRELMLNTLLTYLGQRYRIISITIAIGGLQLRIQCKDASSV